MRKSWHLAFATFSTVFFCVRIASAQSGDIPDKDVTEVRALPLKVIESYNVQDLDSLANVYSESAWHMSLRRPMARGRQEIAEFFGPGMSKFRMEYQSDELDLDISGDTAVLIQSSTLTGFQRDDPENLPVFTEERLSTTIFKRIDGVWFIHRYMDSPNTAAIELANPQIGVSDNPNLRSMSDGKQ